MTKSMYFRPAGSCDRMREYEISYGKSGYWLTLRGKLKWIGTWEDLREVMGKDYTGYTRGKHDNGNNHGGNRRAH